MTARTFGVVATPEHRPQLQSAGEGEPPTYYSFCTCGWTGITVDYARVLHPNNRPQYIEPLQKVVAVYGADVVRPDEVGGDEADALIQVLHHLKYDPVADVDNAEATFQAALHGLHYTAEDAELRSGAQALATAAEEIIEARHRRDIWLTRTVPVLPEVDPIGARLADLVVKNHYASKRDQLTDDDRAFLAREMERLNV